MCVHPSTHVEAEQVQVVGVGSLWVLGIKLRSSGLAASSFPCWVILLASVGHFWAPFIPRIRKCFTAALTSAGNPRICPTFLYSPTRFEVDLSFDSLFLLIQAAWLLKAVTFIDLTTLSGDDTFSNVQRLCYKARYPIQEDLLKALNMHDKGEELWSVAAFFLVIVVTVGARGLDVHPLMRCVWHHVPGGFLLPCADRTLRFLLQKPKIFQAMDSGQILHLWIEVVGWVFSVVRFGSFSI